MADPRVVLRWDVPGAEFRLVHTGATYEMQRDDGEDGWRAAGSEHAFGLLASLIDPEDSDETYVLDPPTGWPRTMTAALPAGA